MSTDPKGNNSMSDLKERISFAMNWLEEVHQPILEVFYNLQQVDLKSNNSEVTEADRNTEIDFRKKLSALFPDDGVIGEEFSDQNTRSSDYTWTIDPIDGTRAFVHGVPFYGTMVGLSKGEEIIFGAISYHSMGEVLYAIKGEGTFWKSKFDEKFQRVQVSNTSKMNEAVLCISGEEYFAMANKTDFLNSLKSDVKMTRTWGDCYGYCLMARGKVDLMIDPLLHEWDIVPLKIIIEEAGGQFLNVDGEQTSHLSTSALCSNKNLKVF